MAKVLFRPKEAELFLPEILSALLLVENTQKKNYLK